MRQVVELDKNLEKDIVLWNSGEILIDKKTVITVSMNFKALAIINEKVAFRIEPCRNLNVCKQIDKSLNNQHINFVFIRTSAYSQMAWGFGNIPVNNIRLKEAYRVGINGKYSIEVFDHVKLLKEFPDQDKITYDDLRARTISTVKAVGVPTLSKYFANTEISVFEIDSKLQEIREEIKIALDKEKIFKNLGIKLIDITAEQVYVNEEDLQIIRERLNG